MAVNESEEQALERLLQRSSPLSRAYQQLKDESPSAALDRAVIAAARDAVGVQAQLRKKSWHWPTLALAATVLLSFGIVMRLALQPLPRSAPPQTPAPASEGLRGTLSATQAPALDSASSAAPSANVVSAPAAAAPEENARFDAPVAKELGRSESSLDEDKKAEAVNQLTTSKPVPVARLPESADPITQAQPPAPATIATPAAQEPAAGALASSPTVNQSFRDEAPSASAAAVSVPKDARQKAALKKTGVKPAKEWLEEIARLRASGQVEAADREYANFLRAYPNYARQDATAPTK
jgi:hypothetical protein